MFKNYFKVAIRNFLKRKGFSLINVLGLATGMAVCLLIILFIQSELSYDRHHKNADNIYRVALERYYPGRSTSYSIIPPSVGAAIKQEYPEVLESTRLFGFGRGSDFFLRIGQRTFEEKKVLAADSNFFRVFTCRLLFGDQTTALQKPNSAVINESTAKKYFGSAREAFGQTFETDGNDTTLTCLITGVAEDWPDNSHFLFDMLISNGTFQFTKRNGFTSFLAYTYISLNPNSSYKTLEAKFPDFVEKYISPEIARVYSQSWEDFKKAGNGYRYFLQPLTKIHLISDLEAELRPNGSMTAVYIFTVVAVFILFLACINFINLSTARSVERAREVGIRKTFGSQRRALIGQFLIESALISILSMFLAFMLINLLLPIFNNLSGKELSISYFFQPSWIFLLFAFAVITGLIAGLYPAFILSSFNPIMVLKGRFKSNRYGLVLRNGLVVFQFAISVILIISAIVVNRQMKYMLGNKLGFKKDHVIVAGRTDLLGDRLDAFKNELLKIPGVEHAGSASTMPGNQDFLGTTWQEAGSKAPVAGNGIMVDEDFEKALGLELKEGRFFSKDFSTDTLSVVINEKAVKELGLQKAIGTRLTSPDGFYNAPDGTTSTYNVIGVVKDFHYHSLHEAVSPLVIVKSKKFDWQSRFVAMRIKGDNFKPTVASIENVWKKFVKEKPFHFYFLDESLAAQYQAEQTIQRIFTIFSGLAIFIACIGLLGLAAYATQQRTREIGIRKVLGASEISIIKMLSKDFVKLVLLSSAIALPVAWWCMNKWLQDFAYRINISLWIFLIAGAAASLIALMTVSFQAIKAASANPVKSLRTE